MCSSSYQKNSFAPSVKTNAANNHPNRTSQPIKNTILSQQISCVFNVVPFQLSRCFADFQSGGYFDALSPLMAPRCVFCRPESFSSLSVYSFQSLSLLGHPNPLLIFLRLCQSHPSMLIPGFYPPAGSHLTLRLPLYNFSRGAGRIELCSRA